MAEISLSAGIRANLNRLQHSSKLFERTADRLSTGKKVNSAVENPTNFFAAVNLQDRASALSSRLDGLGQAVQQIKAADNGISTIRSFISSMRGVVNNALGDSDASSREGLGQQFNELLVQVSEIAKDSGYQGINLLERNAVQTVQFGVHYGDSELKVKGFNLQGAGTDGRGRLDSNGEIASNNLTASVTVNSTAAVSASGYTATSAGNTSVALTGGTGYTELGGDTNSAVIGTAANSASSASEGFAIAIEDTQGAIFGIKGAKAGGGDGMIDWGDDDYMATLTRLTEEIEAFDAALKAQATDLTQNLATISTREDFANELINTLEEGADKLTLADLNEEGANLLALQTSNQLATQTLSLASQQSQQVLQLLG
ncbi:hypothetical protein H5P28_12305 [Ruficoccus amylovorans]|uniref:Flagellin N-terminal domain-containing protein n=1 Tax=Ruficoccus amylovorans TaxID=1804625 RepID=A0A842HIK4_9BACT|nr:flagellin [Ruficoccus amylovorans]MBC2595041.1 hypothetical protein [Ruficoccus amylovorans]